MKDITNVDIKRHLEYLNHYKWLLVSIGKTEIVA